MPVTTSVKRSPRWAQDLAHPVPVAAVFLLALNDHVLKGSGALPGSITGKLSDFAGLFFFPVLLAALARKASLLARGRDTGDRRSLAAATSILTALGFTAVKLIPAANAIVGVIWGKMVMDPTDLIALPMVGLAAAWMLRKDRRASVSHERSDFRRALDFSAVIFAAVASIATSKAPPPPAPPPPPRPVAVAVATDPSCASIRIETCERTATQTLVVLRAQSKTGQACTIDVLRAEEATDSGHTSADVLPKNVMVSAENERTFALTFLRAVSPSERAASLRARAVMRATSADGSGSDDEMELSGACVGR